MRTRLLAPASALAALVVVLGARPLAAAIAPATSLASLVVGQAPPPPPPPPAPAPAEPPAAAPRVAPAPVSPAAPAAPAPVIRTVVGSSMPDASTPAVVTSAPVAPVDHAPPVIVTVPGASQAPVTLAPATPPRIIVVQPEAVAGSAPRGVTPAASATYSAYDYLCTEFDAGNASEVLNQAGGRGWELASIGKLAKQDLACFRRPHPGATRQ